MLEAEGWKSSIVEDPQPAYEVETQKLISWYEDCGTYIARRWKVTPRQPSEADKDEALTILGVAL